MGHEIREALEVSQTWGTGSMAQSISKGLRTREAGRVTQRMKAENPWAAGVSPEVQRPQDLEF